MKKASKIKPIKDVKLLTLEVINGRYTLVADGKPTSASSTHKYYATSKKSLFMGPNTKFEDRTKTSELAGTSALDAAAQDNPALAFDIDQRFVFLDELVTMVAQRKVPSAIVTGPGGLGKSHTVIEALKKAGLKDIYDLPSGTPVNSPKLFKTIKGFSTVKGLYESLYEHRDSLLVYDDCDSAFDDPDAANLLKAALDSYDKRFLSWNKSSAFGDDGIPRSFQFTGGIIFISNKPQTKIDQAVRTRAMCVDVSMTVDQILGRMATIMKSESFMPNVTLEEKKDALELLKELKDNIKNLSLRSLIQAATIRHNRSKDDWKPLASYMLLSAA